MHSQHAEFPRKNRMPHAAYINTLFFRSCELTAELRLCWSHVHLSLSIPPCFPQPGRRGSNQNSRFKPLGRALENSVSTAATRPLPLPYSSALWKSELCPFSASFPASAKTITLSNIVICNCNIVTLTSTGHEWSE